MKILSEKCLIEEKSNNSDKVAEVTDKLTQINKDAELLGILMKNLDPLRAQLIKVIEQCKIIRLSNDDVNVHSAKIELRHALVMLENETEQIDKYINKLDQLKANLYDILLNVWSLARED